MVLDTSALLALLLDEPEAEAYREALEDDETRLVSAATLIETARALGGNGVPFFVVDRTYGASGAQPPEVLLQLLERAWADSHPLLTTVPAADGCDDGSCAV